MEESTADLTPKQQVFCLEYLKDFNATRAALEAGYSKKTAYRTGAENLRKPQVQRFLAEQAKARMEKAGIEVDAILGGWKDIAFADVRRYLKKNDLGYLEINIDAALADKDNIIHKIKQRDLGQTPEGKRITETQLEMYDRRSGLEALSKYLKLYQEGKQEEPVKPAVDQEEAKRRAFERLEQFLLGDPDFSEGLAEIFRRRIALWDRLRVLVEQDGTEKEAVAA